MSRVRIFCTDEKYCTKFTAYNSLRAARGGYKGWNDHCADLEQRFNKHTYGFAASTDPTVPVRVSAGVGGAGESGVSGVEVAAVFVEAGKFKQTGVYMSKYACYAQSSVRMIVDFVLILTQCKFFLLCC